MQLNSEKVLVVGLGTLGGGVATVKWLLGKGADVTVTDLRSAKDLRTSIEELSNFTKTLSHRKGTMRAHGTPRFVLGRHRMEDFMDANLVVVGAGVKIIGNKFLAAAKKKKIPIVNDLTLFLARVKNPVIAVTGTRGKTTTANWTAHFLAAKFKGVRASGNSSDDALLKLLPRLERRKGMPAVLELSSFQLEALNSRPDNSTELSGRRKAPDVAIVTNVSRDHLNRHETMRNYALAKANIFRNQTKGQKLILNADDPWTKFFLAQKPKAEIYLISVDESHLKKENLTRPGGFGSDRMKERIQGALCCSIVPRGEIIFTHFDGKQNKKQNVFSSETVRRVEELGKHNVYNFLASALAAHLAGVPWSAIERRAKRLPQIPLRQEMVLKKKGLTVVNDSAGTSPEATIAAIKRFAGTGRLVLITGGTDKNLEFAVLAREIRKSVPPEDLFLLNGSATKKLVAALRKIGYFKGRKPRSFEDLGALLSFVRRSLQTSAEGGPLPVRQAGASPASPSEAGRTGGKNYLPAGDILKGDKLKTIVLFSPGSASFEKFKNEFDRGAKFTALARRLIDPVKK